jgi:hypothetical protein
MFMSGRVRLVVFAIPVLFAAALFAQQYQEHDHTVFHRPAPATTMKRPATAVGTPATTRTPVAASSANSKTPESNRRHELTYGQAPTLTEPHTTQTQQAPK